MSWSLMVRVVLSVVVAALVLIGLTRDGDSGEPEEAALPAPTATARATGLTDARTAEPAPTTEPAPAIAAALATETPRAEYTPTPRETPTVATPPPTPIATPPPITQAPLPNSDATPEPAPRIVRVFPTETPEPTGAPVPVATPRPAITPVADLNVTPVPVTPTPLPTPVSPPPPTVAGEIDPPTRGVCLHCWVYVGAHRATRGDPDFDLTERFLRERYDARSERVGRCDTCPVVFSPYDLLEAATLLHARDISDSAGTTWRILNLPPVAERYFAEIIDNRLGEAIANGWLVPVSESHHIRDVAGMIAYPLQPYPRHEPGAWALTWRGFREIRYAGTGEAPVPVPVPEDDLSAVPLDPECSYCWRYVETPTFLLRMQTEQLMRERFPADDDHVGTCGTCPWMHDGSDIQPALDAGSLSVVTAAHGVQYISLGDPAARLLDPALRLGSPSADFLTGIGENYSARQAGRMLAYPDSPEPRHLTPRTGVITNLGMAALKTAAAQPPVPYTPVDASFLLRRDDLALQFCVADTGNAAVNTQIRDLTALAIAAWNDALDVTAFLLTGACDPETAVARYNQLNEVFAMAPGQSAEAIAFVTHDDRDVGITIERLSTPACTLATLIHEFGHVLGFVHSRDWRSVMYGSSRPESECASETIQDWEVAQLREFWGFD